ncbi:squalene synthase HpnC [Thermithiobacillus plumbiphilus]|uniref:Squalene synthase HpnC n=1 Tax=Thermithiobacillus plumbiphilus TaxID=1729899 RepID=A0ABU9D5C0_9PROT
MPESLTRPAADVRQAYAWCRRLAAGHYENFPIASLLLPRSLRDPVAAIYAFARLADDLADEGSASPDARLNALAAWRAKLHAAARGQADEPVFIALADAIPRHDLPVGLLEDLLSAFEQDVGKTRYASFGELMDYCRRSANPIGRLLLHLYGVTDARSLGQSDAICSALQLINFWQDVGVDLKKGRIYLPKEDMQRFRVSEADLLAGRMSLGLNQLMRFEVDRTRRLLQSGAPLGKTLKGRLGFNLRLTVLGGAAILEAIHKNDYDVLHKRPVIRWNTWPRLLQRAILAR